MVTSLFTHPDIISRECFNNLKQTCTLISTMSPKQGTCHSLRVLASDFLRSVFEAESGLSPDANTVKICDNLIETGDLPKNPPIGARLRLKLLNLYHACRALFGFPFGAHSLIIEDLSIDLICFVHSIIMKDLLPPEQIGCFRTIEVAPRGSLHRYAPYCTIRPRLETVLEEFVNSKAKIMTSGQNQLADMVKLTAIFFSEFLMIHPFSNGNGRTARLLASFALRDFTIILFTPACPRDEYLAALTSRWRSNNHPRSFQPLMRLFVQSLSIAVSHYVWMETEYV